MCLCAHASRRQCRLLPFHPLQRRSAGGYTHMHDAPPTPCVYIYVMYTFGHTCHCAYTVHGGASYLVYLLCRYLHLYIFVKPAVLCKPWLKAPWLKLALLASDAIRSGGGVRISFPCLVGVFNSVVGNAIEDRSEAPWVVGREHASSPNWGASVAPSP